MTKEITKGSYNSTTKQQIFDAYNEVLSQLKAQHAVKHDPAGEVKAKQQAQTVAKAENLTEVSIEDQVVQLQKNFADALSRLGTSFAEEIKGYETIKEAVELKKAELKEIHDIEAEAFTLAALVNSHQTIKAKHETDMAERKAELQTQLQDLQNQIVQARNDFQEQLKAEKAQIALERKREKEEYEYNFIRRKRREEDQLVDELDARRREFEEEVSERQDELNTYESNLDKRDEEITVRENKVEELEIAVAAFPEQLAQSRTEAAEAAKKEEQKVSAIKENYIKKDAETKVQLADNKVTLLEKALEEEKAKNAELATKLDAAYGKIQDMAMASVDSSKAQNAFETMARNFSDKNQK